MQMVGDPWIASEALVTPGSGGTGSWRVPGMARRRIGDIRRFDPEAMTVRQSAVACGVSTDTVRRRLAEGIPGARRNDDGSWSIPIGGLAAVGLVPRLERLDPKPGPYGHAGEEVEGDGDGDLRQRLAAAEALATARAEHIADLRSEVEMLRRLVSTGGPA